MEHPGSSRSESAADRLRESGYDAVAIEGGFPAWREAGYPLERAQASGAAATPSE